MAFRHTVFSLKKGPSEMFERVLNTPLFVSNVALYLQSFLFNFEQDLCRATYLKE